MIIACSEWEAGIYVHMHITCATIYFSNGDKLRRKCFHEAAINQICSEAILSIHMGYCTNIDTVIS